MGKLTNLKSRLSSAPNRLATLTAGTWCDDKKSSTARGYKWQQARTAYLVKHPFCAYCLRDFGIPVSDGCCLAVSLSAWHAWPRGIGLLHANIIDHVVPHRGDMKLFWDSANWQSMCGPRHSGEKQRGERSACSAAPSHPGWCAGAAVAAVQYTHAKKGDGGKQDEKKDAAKTAAQGRFGAPPPPRRRLSGGGK